MAVSGPRGDDSARREDAAGPASSRAERGGSVSDLILRLGSALQQAGDPLAIFGLDNSLDYANPRWAKLHGRGPGDMHGASLDLFHAPDQMKDDVEPLLARVHELDVAAAEVGRVRADGLVFRSKTVGTLLRDADGRPWGVLLRADPADADSGDDILSNTDRQLATLLSNLPGMAYRCLNDIHWTMELVSGGCVALTGYQSEELLQNAGIAYADLIHPDDRGLVRDVVDGALAQRRPFRIQYRIFNSHGEERWVWEQGVGVFGADGELQALEGFITDVTDRVRAELDGRNGEDRLRALAQSMREGYVLHEVVRDRQGQAQDFRVLEINPAFERLVRRPREAVVGRLLSEMLPERFAELHERYLPVVDRGERVEFILRGIKRDVAFGMVAYPAGRDRFVAVMNLEEGENDD